MLCNRVVPCSSHFISSFHATGTETYPSSSGGCSLQRGCSRTLRLWCCRTSGAVFPAPLPFADAYIYIYDIYIYIWYGIISWCVVQVVFWTLLPSREGTLPLLRRIGLSSMWLRKTRIFFSRFRCRREEYDSVLWTSSIDVVSCSLCPHVKLAVCEVQCFQRCIYSGIQALWTTFRGTFMMICQSSSQPDEMAPALEPQHLSTGHHRHGQVVNETQWDSDLDTLFSLQGAVASGS